MASDNKKCAQCTCTYYGVGGFWYFNSSLEFSAKFDNMILFPVFLVAAKRFHPMKSFRYFQSNEHNVFLFCFSILLYTRYGKTATQTLTITKTQLISISNCDLMEMYLLVSFLFSPMFFLSYFFAPVRGSRVRKLWCNINAIVATRRNRPLLV